MRRTGQRGTVAEMSAVPDQPRSWTIPPRAVDTGLAIFVTVVGVGSAVGESVAHGDHRLLPVVVILALVAAVPVAWRRSYPLWALGLCEVAFLVRELVEPRAAQPGSLGVALVMYAFALTRGRETSLRALLILLGLDIMGGSATVLIGGGNEAFGNVAGPCFLVVGAWALGDNVRTRRAYLASLEERAARLEREREDGAERAVGQERARIARELHDVVAHHVSAIAVIAGAAEEIAERNPSRAREALQSIRATSRDALSEMRAIVGVLAPGPDTELAPQPRLAELDRLVTQARAAGLPVPSRRGHAAPAPRGSRSQRLPHRPGGAHQHAETRGRSQRRGGGPLGRGLGGAGGRGRRPAHP